MHSHYHYKWKPSQADAYDGAWGGGLSTIVVPTGPSNRVVDRRVVDDGHVVR